ncbi:MAG: hypothetical protein ACP5KF_00755 [Sulfurihydrogenibium sp.]
MLDSNVEKIYKVEPVSDNISKREFIRKKKKSETIKDKEEKEIKENACITKDGHIDCYV